MKIFYLLLVKRIKENIKKNTNNEYILLFAKIFFIKIVNYKVLLSYI